MTDISFLVDQRIRKISVRDLSMDFIIQNKPEIATLLRLDKTFLCKINYIHLKKTRPRKNLDETWSKIA